jgi:hypothetical protein
MTTRELIKILKTMPPTAHIFAVEKGFVTESGRIVPDTIFHINRVKKSPSKRAVEIEIDDLPF